jgi:hypothetical protein
MQMEMETLEDALAVYFEAAGDNAPIPAGYSEYDETRGGWVLENVNGVLALVRDDGTVVEPVYDPDDGCWVLPE